MPGDGTKEQIQKQAGSGMKECFGQLAHMKVRYRSSTGKHFLHVDEEKLKECDRCHLFQKCMFVKYNELFRDMIRMLDEAGTRDSRPRLG